MEQLTADLLTSSEQSLEISKEAKQLGLIIRYDTIEYRNETIDFLSSVDGVQCFAQWRGKLIDLGLNNIHYREDICKYVDRTLDLITDFRDCPDFAGAKLEYFHNGDFRDIRLVYKGRLIRCFLVVGPVNEESLIAESVKILRTSGVLTDD
jgi:hypothetical protein